MVWWVGLILVLGLFNAVLVAIVARQAVQAGAAAQRGAPRKKSALPAHVAELDFMSLGETTASTTTGSTTTASTTTFQDMTRIGWQGSREVSVAVSGTSATAGAVRLASDRLVLAGASVASAVAGGNTTFTVTVGAGIGTTNAQSLGVTGTPAEVTPPVSDIDLDRGVVFYRTATDVYGVDLTGELGAVQINTTTLDSAHSIGAACLTGTGTARMFVAALDAATSNLYVWTASSLGGTWTEAVMAGVTADGSELVVTSSRGTAAALGYVITQRNAGTGATVAVVSAGGTVTGKDMIEQIKTTAGTLSMCYDATNGHFWVVGFSSDDVIAWRSDGSGHDIISRYTVYASPPAELDSNGRTACYEHEGIVYISFINPAYGTLDLWRCVNPFGAPGVWAQVWTKAAGASQAVALFVEPTSGGLHCAYFDGSAIAAYDLAGNAVTGTSLTPGVSGLKLDGLQGTGVACLSAGLVHHVNLCPFTQLAVTSAA